MYATEDAVLQMVERLKPFVKQAKKTAGKGAVWKDLVFEAWKGPDSFPFWQFNATTVGFFKTPIEEMMYDCFGVACAEVEVDVLTGEKRVLRVDIFYDMGAPFNPAIDIGQAEGAFVMGMGNMLLEGMEYHPETGRNLTPNTWDYKIPSIHDIPETFNVHILDLESERIYGGWPWVMAAKSFLFHTVLGFPWKPSPTVGKKEKAFRSSKAVGEPPLLLSTSVHSALRQAIHAARGHQVEDVKEPILFPMPLEVESIAKLTWDEVTDLQQLRGARGGSAGGAAAKRK